MNSERIKAIQQGTAHPNSISVHNALMQVWNECEQVDVIYEEYREWRSQKGIQLQCLELGPATIAECYAFAGRMRKFLPGCQHHHVGLLAHDLVMRTNRKGMPLEQFEQRLINLFGDKPDIWKDR